MTSFNLSSLKFLSPSTVTLGIRASMYELEVGGKNQSVIEGEFRV